MADHLPARPGAAGSGRDTRRARRRGGPVRAIDADAVIRALGSGPAVFPDAEDVGGENGPTLPEPLASVVDHLGDELTRRAFVPTAELIAALGVEPTAFGRDMSELGCAPRPGRVTEPDGTVRQVRGYVTADLRAAVERSRDG